VNLLALIPLRDWLYLGLALAVAALGALFVSHERELGAQRAEAQLQHERAAVALAGAQAASAAAAETDRRTAATLENVNAALQTTQRLAAAAAAATADRSAFSLQLDAYARAHAGAGNPVAASGGAPAADAVVVLARLLDRMDARATDLAQLADQRGAAGAACERQYDSLKP